MLKLNREKIRILHYDKTSLMRVVFSSFLSAYINWDKIAYLIIIIIIIVIGPKLYSFSKYTDFYIYERFYCS